MSDMQTKTQDSTKIAGWLIYEDGVLVGCVDRPHGTTSTIHAETVDALRAKGCTATAIYY